MSKNLGKIDDVDTRVVEMQFDNKQFEKGASTTLNTLEKLKAALKFDGVNKGFDSLQKGIDAITFNPITRQLDNVSGAFTTLYGSIKRNFFDKISNDIIQVGANLYNTTVGQIISGGKTRAMNIAQAKFKMEGMNVAWEDIKDDLDYAVGGTAYGLDAAASIASQLVASGVQVGEGMKKALRGVSGVAAMTSSSYEEIGQVFAAVAGQGKAMAMQLNQLSLRGINAASTIGDYLGKTEAEVRDMASKGQISFEIFADAMDSAFGEHAKEANKTFTGAMSNIRAALSKIGELFYGPFYDAAIAPLNTIRETISMIKDGLVGSVDGFSTKFGLRTTAERLDQIVHVMGDIANILLKGIQNGLKRALKYLKPLNRVMITWLHNLKEVRSWLKSIIPSDATEKLDNVKSSIEGITEAEKEMAYGVWEGKYGDGAERIKALGDSYERVQTYLQALIENNFDAAKAEASLGLSSEKTTEVMEEQSEIGEKLNKIYTIVKTVFESVAALAIYLGRRIKSVSGRIANDLYEMIHPMSTMTGFMSHSFREADSALSGFLDRNENDSPLERLLIAIANTIYLITEGVWGLYKALKNVVSIAVGTMRQLVGTNVLDTLADVIYFINDWLRPEHIIKPIKDVLEIFAILGKNLALIFKSVAVAFASVFNSGSSGVLGDFTGGVLNFVRTLELTQNDVDNLIRIFRGLFSIIKIGLELVGTLAKGFNILTGNLENEDSILLRILGTIGDFFYELKNIIESAHVFEKIVYGIVVALEFLIETLEEATGVLRGDWLVDVLKGFLGFINYVAENGIIAGIEALVGIIISTIQGIIAAINKFPVVVGLIKDLFGGIALIFKGIFKGLLNVGGMIANVTDAINKFGAAYVKVVNSLFDAILPTGYKTPFGQLTEGANQMLEDYVATADNIRTITDNSVELSNKLADGAGIVESNGNYAAKIAEKQIKGLLGTTGKAAKASEKMAGNMDDVTSNMATVVDQQPGMMGSGSAIGMAAMLPTPEEISKYKESAEAISKTVENAEHTAKVAKEGAAIVEGTNKTVGIFEGAWNTATDNINSFFNGTKKGTDAISTNAKAVEQGAKKAAIDEETAMKALQILQSMNAMFVSIVTSISFLSLSRGVYNFGRGIRAIGGAFAFIKKTLKYYRHRLINAYLFDKLTDGLKKLVVSLSILAFTIMGMSYMIKDIGDTDVVVSSLAIVAGLLISVGIFVAIVSRVTSMFGLLSVGAVVAIIVSLALAITTIWIAMDYAFGKDEKEKIEEMIGIVKGFMDSVVNFTLVIIIAAAILATLGGAVSALLKNKVLSDVTSVLKQVSPLIFSMAAAVLMLSIAGSVLLSASKGLEESNYKRLTKIMNMMAAFIGIFAVIIGIFVFGTAALFTSAKDSSASANMGYAYKEVTKLVNSIGGILVLMLSSIAIIGAIVFLAKNLWADDEKQFEDFIGTMENIADGIKGLLNGIALLVGVVALAAELFAANTTAMYAFNSFARVVVALMVGLDVFLLAVLGLIVAIGVFDINPDQVQTAMNMVFGVILALAVGLALVTIGLALLIEKNDSYIFNELFKDLGEEIRKIITVLVAVFAIITASVAVLAITSKVADVKKFKTLALTAMLAFGGIIALTTGIALVARDLSKDSSTFESSKRIFKITDKMLALMAKVEVVIIAFMASLAIISVAVKGGDLAEGVVVLGLSILVILGIAALIAVMAKSLYKAETPKMKKVTKILSSLTTSLAVMAGAIALLMGSMALVLYIVDKTDAVNSGALAIVTGFAIGLVALITVILIVAAIISKKNSVVGKKTGDLMLALAGAVALMCIGLAAIALALALLGTVTLNPSQMWSAIGIFAVILAIVGAVFAIVYHLSGDIDKSRLGTAALVMLAYAGSVALVSLAMSAMIVSLSILSEVDINWEKVKPLLWIFGITLLLVGTVMVLVSALTKTKLDAGFVAGVAVSLGLAIASIAVAFLIMGAVLKDLGTMPISDRALEIFKKMAGWTAGILAIVGAVAVAAAISKGGFHALVATLGLLVVMVSFIYYIKTFGEVVSDLVESGAAEALTKDGGVLLQSILYIGLAAVSVFGVIAIIAGLVAAIPALGATYLLDFGILIAEVTVGLMLLAGGMTAWVGVFQKIIDSGLLKALKDDSETLQDGLRMVFGSLLMIFIALAAMSAFLAANGVGGVDFLATFGALLGEVALGIAAIGGALMVLAAGIAAVGVAMRIVQGESLSDILGDGIGSSKGGLGGLSDQLLAGYLISGKATGEMYAEGINRGLVDSNGKISDSAKYLASTLDGTTKQQLGIHSPSTKGYEIGEFYVEGIALGESDNISLVKRQSVKLADAMTGSLESALTNSTISDDLAATASDGFQAALNQVVVTANEGFGDFKFDYSSLFDDAPLYPTISPVVNSEAVSSAIEDASEDVGLSPLESTLGMDLESLINPEALLTPLEEMFTGDTEGSFISKLLGKFTDSEGNLNGTGGIQSTLSNFFGEDKLSSLLDGFKDDFSIESIEKALGSEGILNSGLKGIMSKLTGLNDNLAGALGDGSLGTIANILTGGFSTLGDEVMRAFGYDPDKYVWDWSSLSYAEIAPANDFVYTQQKNGWSDIQDYIPQPGDAGYSPNIRPD